MFEKHHRKGRRVEYGQPTDNRYETEQDLQALIKAKKIENDAPRHQRAKSLAKERAAEKRRRGKSQANIDRKDNSLNPAHEGDHGEA